MESVLGALETELLNGQPEVNKIAALRWDDDGGDREDDGDGDDDDGGKDGGKDGGDDGDVDNLRWTRLWLSGDRNLFLVSKLELKRWLLLTKFHSRVRGLFPGREPFWAGYGNKAWDILAYKVLTVFCSCLCVTVIAYFVFFFCRLLG